MTAITDHVVIFIQYASSIEPCCLPFYPLNDLIVVANIKISTYKISCEFWLVSLIWQWLIFICTHWSELILTIKNQILKEMNELYPIYCISTLLKGYSALRKNWSWKRPGKEASHWSLFRLRFRSSRPYWYSHVEDEEFPGRDSDEARHVKQPEHWNEVDVWQVSFPDETH